MSAREALELVGSVGGILSSIKLFVLDKRLTRRQRLLLVAIDSTKNKEISYQDMTKYNLGLIFNGKWKGSDLLAKFVLDISDYEQEKDDETYSHNAEIQLRDLADKTFMVAAENSFRLTLKGQKWARFWAKLLRYKLGWIIFFPRKLKKVYDSENFLLSSSPNKK